MELLVINKRGSWKIPEWISLWGGGLGECWLFHHEHGLYANGDHVRELWSISTPERYKCVSNVMEWKTTQCCRSQEILLYITFNSTQQGHLNVSYYLHSLQCVSATWAILIHETETFLAHLSNMNTHHFHFQKRTKKKKKEKSQEMYLKWAVSK